MTAQPAYFEPIRQKSARRWEQLEGDPELAGPWHQLFKQVQSPRHILSELLQNADDAGATKASIRIENGTFFFQHNGEDFSEEHFASLCRFGYSNKRGLHTIGFRGIGFKSTFSLGKRVELYTPTLSVAFHQNRFTEPKWQSSNFGSDGLTTIRVAISDRNRTIEVEKNLQEWLKSPVSLLFFKHIRQVTIGDSELHWKSGGPGPVPNTEWFSLHDSSDAPLLIARSAPEPFPADALAEIREERMVNVEDDDDFPPCSVEIVLGVEGRLFVVLPTGVKTPLPFACNAPFIQDPARLKIKDPETSPTNSWLLRRAGKLAADVMLQWLARTESENIQRARAYELMPDVDRDDNSLAGTCGTIVEEEFGDVLKGQCFLLTDEGTLSPSKQSIIIPRELFDVWPSSQVAAFLDEKARPALSRHVSDDARTRLLNWGHIDEIDEHQVLGALRSKHLPKPERWLQLLNLWAYIAPVITSYRYKGIARTLHIVPVQGKDVLHASNEVVRLGEKKLLPSEDDWHFLGARLSVLNQNWLRYITEQRRLAETEDDHELSERIDAASAILEGIGLNEPSDTGKVIAQVAADLLAQDTVTLLDAIRIAQIAAKLSASVSNQFRFASQDRTLKSANSPLLFDADGTLEALFPEDWIERHLLHPDYVKTFTSCTREEWLRWVSSGRSGLYTFIPFEETTERYYSRKEAEDELERRGFQGRFSPRYTHPRFSLDDWDFDDAIWEHWEALAQEDSSIWGNIAERILMEPPRFWADGLTATLSEEASNGYRSCIIRDGLAPSWILKLRERECLPDTRGIYRKPVELLRRTPETEALIDVELFIKGLLDNEQTRPLLQLLGVSGVPTGPNKLLNRLRTLTKVDNPPVYEIEKWYRRLDQIIDTCSTEDFNAVRSAFSEERLILTDRGEFSSSLAVFLSTSDEDVPDAETVHPSVKELTLWQKIGVAPYPTVEKAISWLQGLPSGHPLPSDDMRRARALLKRYGKQVWEECAHWINLAGEWAPIEDFEYAMTMQTLIPWSHLHHWVKQKTADLQMLSTDASEASPFSILPPLAAHINDQFCSKSPPQGKKQSPEWVRQLGVELQRVKLDDEEETARIRHLASELASTNWQTTNSIEIIPYIDGKPAGTARRADVLWMDRILYAKDKPIATLARPISQELGRAFRRTEITDAIKICFDRPAAFVSDYMEENFALTAPEEIEDYPKDSPVEPTFPGRENHSQDQNDESAATGDDSGQHDQTVASPNGNDNNGHADQTDNKPDVDDTDNFEDSIPVVRPKPKPVKPSLMERFALSDGFHKDDEQRFFDNHGNWIRRVSGELFPWEQRSASGDVVKHYLPKNHCLEHEPLELGADIWNVVEQNPETYVLVLSNWDGNPVEVTGTHLLEMRKRGDLTLHPSSYRLVYRHDA